MFQQIGESGDVLDVVVNSAWGGYEKMVEDGQFTWNLPFWKQPIHRWTGMMDAGVRAAFFASAHAAKQMAVRGQGLIVNISFWAKGLVQQLRSVEVHAPCPTTFCP